MPPKTVKPMPRWKIPAGVLLAFCALIGASLIFARLCSPELSEKPHIHTPEEIANTQKICHQPESLKSIRYSVVRGVPAREEKQAAEFFRKYPDASPETVADAVKKGKLPAWYPRGEAPVLQDLVREGVLPPVAQRVGPEPVVMDPLEGVHQYGGVWVQFVAGGASNEMFAAMIRMTYPRLFRFSPLGYPIVPHIAKS